jgi:hypothetical protein
MEVLDVVVTCWVAFKLGAYATATAAAAAAAASLKSEADSTTTGAPKSASIANSLRRLLKPLHKRWMVMQQMRRRALVYARLLTNILKAHCTQT